MNKKKKSCFYAKNRTYRLGPLGLEQSSENHSQVTINKALSDNPLDTSKAVGVQNPVHFPPDLDTVVKAWAELPEHVRQTISTLVDVSKKK